MARVRARRRRYSIVANVAPFFERAAKPRPLEAEDEELRRAGESSGVKIASGVLMLASGGIPAPAVQAAVQTATELPKELPGVAPHLLAAVQAVLSPLLPVTAYAADGTGVPGPPAPTRATVNQQLNDIQANANQQKSALHQHYIDYAMAASYNHPAFEWVPKGGYADPFPGGWCTDYAEKNSNIYYRTGGIVNGDAGQWIAEVQAYNRTVSADKQIPILDKPVPGALAVYYGWNSQLGRYAGHVAVVTTVDPDGVTFHGSEAHVTGAFQVTHYTSVAGESRFGYKFEGFIAPPPEAQAYYAQQQQKMDQIQQQADQQKQQILDQAAAQEKAAIAPLAQKHADAQQQLEQATAAAQAAEAKASAKRNEAANLAAAYQAQRHLAAAQQAVAQDQTALTTAQTNLQTATANYQQALASGNGIDEASSALLQARGAVAAAQNQMTTDTETQNAAQIACQATQANIPQSLQGKDLTQAAQQSAADAQTLTQQAQAAAAAQTAAAANEKQAAQALVDARNQALDNMGDTYGRAMVHQVQLLDQADKNNQAADAAVGDGKNQEATTAAQAQVAAAVDKTAHDNGPAAGQQGPVVVGGPAGAPGKDKPVVVAMPPSPAPTTLGNVVVAPPATSPAGTQSTGNSGAPVTPPPSQPSSPPATPSPSAGTSGNGTPPAAPSAPSAPAGGTPASGGTPAPGGGRAPAAQGVGSGQETVTPAQVAPTLDQYNQLQQSRRAAADQATALDQQLAAAQTADQQAHQAYDGITSGPELMAKDARLAGLPDQLLAVEVTGAESGFGLHNESPLESNGTHGEGAMQISYGNGHNMDLDLHRLQTDPLYNMEIAKARYIDPAGGKYTAFCSTDADPAQDCGHMGPSYLQPGAAVLRPGNVAAAQAAVNAENAKFNAEQSADKQLADLQQRDQAAHTQLAGLDAQLKNFKAKPVVVVIGPTPAAAAPDQAQPAQAPAQSPQGHQGQNGADAPAAGGNGLGD